MVTNRYLHRILHGHWPGAIVTNFGVGHYECDICSKDEIKAAMERKSAFERETSDWNRAAAAKIRSDELRRRILDS